MPPTIHPFFDPATWTVTYVVFAEAHAGCAINKLQGTTLVCPCHGSEFDAETGKVLRAPATVPLHALSVEERNGKIVAGPGA